MFTHPCTEQQTRLVVCCVFNQRHTKYLRDCRGSLLVYISFPVCLLPYCLLTNSLQCISHKNYSPTAS